MNRPLCIHDVATRLRNGWSHLMSCVSSFPSEVAKVLPEYTMIVCCAVLLMLVQTPVSLLYASAKSSQPVWLHITFVCITEMLCPCVVFQG